MSQTTESKQFSIQFTLNEIQQRLKAPKGQFNSFGKYYYRSCEDILEALKPLLGDYCTTLTISDDIVEVGGRIYVKATVTISNDKGESLSTTAFAREEETKKGMDGSQITGAASSYARKYALNGLFAIDDNKDSDSMDNTKPVQVTIKHPTPAQLTRLHAIIGEYVKVKNADVNKTKEWIKSTYKVESTKDLTLEQYDQLIAVLEKSINEAKQA